MSNLQQKLRHAWQLRIDQRNNEALACLVKLMSDLSIPLGHLDRKTYKDLLWRKQDSCKSSNLMDVILLKASLRRAQGQYVESQNILESLRELVVEKGITASFYYDLEQGLNCYLKGDYISALEYFLSAKNNSQDAWQQACAELNILSCYDNLGLETKSLFNEVNNLIAKLQPGLGTEGLHDQITTFKLRQDFKNGDIEEVCHNFPRTNKLEPSQSLYFCLWVKELPYHSSYAPQSVLLNKLFSPQKSFFLRSYRIRTLQNCIQIDDENIPKPNVWVERFYLWVWRWLQNPRAIPSSQLGFLLRNLAQYHDDLSVKLPKEDGYFLNNALLWLKLFDKKLRQDIGSLLALDLTDFQDKAPLMALEYLVVRYLISLRDDNDSESSWLRASMMQHPLWENEQIRFKQLIKAVENRTPLTNDPLAELSDHLIQLIYLPHDPVTKKYRCRINMNTYSISYAHKEIYSEKICRSLHLLKQCSAVSFEEFLKEVFDIKHYQPIIHNQKIYNHILQLNKTFSPLLTFRAKSTMVIAQGDWSQLHVIEVPLPTRLLRHQPYWTAFVNKDQLGHATDVDMGSIIPPISSESGLMASKKLVIKRTMSRRELERIVKRSRATTNRLLAQWKEQGIVEQIGKARSAKYILSDALMEQLQQGELL